MVNDRLQKLRAQREALAARIRREEGRERSRHYKEDTRRKVLAGAAVLQEQELHPDFKPVLRGILDRALTRPNDRALFVLPPRPQEEMAAAQADPLARMVEEAQRGQEEDALAEPGREIEAA